MTPLALAMRSLWYHRASHLIVALGAAVGIAAIVGAMTIGSSVRSSLETLSSQRLGKTNLILSGGDRLFRAKLGPDMAERLSTTVSSIFIMPTVAVHGVGESQRRIGAAQLIGVDDKFWDFAWSKPDVGPLQPGQTILSKELAQRLGASVGDTVLLRVEKPSLLPRDMPLSSGEDPVEAISVKVSAIAGDDQMGRFTLASQQQIPLNVFVPLSWLNEQLGLADTTPRMDRANVLLIGSGRGVTSARAGEVLKQVWRADDAQCAVRAVQTSGSPVYELRSDRVFIDAPIVAAAQNASPDLVGVLTYFVSELKSGDRSVPYSMVTAIGNLQHTRPLPTGTKGSPHSGANAIMPADLSDDETMVNQWLADELNLRVGSSLEMSYIVPGPGRTLHERTSTFRVRGILPMEGPSADRTLMPDFPGLATADNCRDWDPSMPVDLKKIRDKDEQYWKQYRGTPKAFVTLRAGRAMWANRFGDLTAMRVPQFKRLRDRLLDAVREGVDPASLGLRIVDVRERAAASTRQAIDFGQLFGGLSFFLIASSALLAGLLMRLSFERRAAEWVTLRAMGIERAMIRKLVWIEAGVVLLIAVLIGVPMGLGFTWAALRGLATIWSGAVAGAEVAMSVKPIVVAMGAIIGAGASAIALALAMRGLSHQSEARMLNEGVMATESSAPPDASDASRRWRLLPSDGSSALITALLAVAIAGAGVVLNPSRPTGAFFASGALLLISGLLASRWALRQCAGAGPAERLTVAALGLRNAARRRGRSMAVVALVACGVFLVVAVGANRKDAAIDATRRDSGTGGFAFYARTTIPLFEDLNTAAGRQKLGIRRGALDGVSVVPMRVRPGDDASCLNLSRAQEPTLLAVAARPLADRGAFRFASSLEAHDARLSSPWLLLDAPQEGAGVVPAIGDKATVVWGLGKSLGDTLIYTDERGRNLSVRIVALLEDSMLQGCLLISEGNFEKHFPSSAGYQALLVDGPHERASEVEATLNRALRDFGPELTPAVQRLAMFQRVENTYLAIFQSLGGLGLLLGGGGLAAVVMRNVLERRAELSMLRAVGFAPARVRRLLLIEHGGLLCVGLAIGIISAAVAIGPALRTGISPNVMTQTVLTAIAISLSGLAWVWLAARWSMRGSPMRGLRSE